MDWLLTHPETESGSTEAPPADTTSPDQSGNPEESPDPDQTSPVFEEGTASQAPSATTDTDVRPKTTTTSTSGAGNGAESPQKSRNNSVRKQSKAQTILESFRAYKRRKFKPNHVVSLLR